MAKQTEKKGKVTIKDVAREAGVSISTVSNAINNVDVLAPETKAHILEVADRLHYIPNLNGRNLKSKSTKVIGLFITSLKGPYFGILTDTMFWEAMKYGYELNIFVTWDKRSNMNNILGRNIDGSVILDSDIEEEELGRIIEYEVPAVFLDREVAEPTVGSVVFDSYQDGVAAAELFLKKGAKRICCIQGIMANYDGAERYRGFVETLEKAGHKIEPEYVLKGYFEKERAKEGMKELLAKGLPVPDAVFAGNDLSAIGCMEALKEAGYRVPEDTIVLGVDNIELGEWYRPTLSTIQTQAEKQGIAAIEKLVKLINGEKSGDVTKLQGTMIERESTNRTVAYE